MAKRRGNKEGSIYQDKTGVGAPRSISDFEMGSVAENCSAARPAPRLLRSSPPLFARNN
jgi:hypothetical protein